MKICVYENYSLSGPVNSFEAYIFATTDYNIKKQDEFPDVPIILYNYNIMEKLQWNLLESRKLALKRFNESLKTKLGHTAVGEDLGCQMLDIMPEDGEELEFDNVLDSYHNLQELVEPYFINNSSVAVICPHLRQTGRYPHVHILYDKTHMNGGTLYDFLMSDE